MRADPRKLAASVPYNGRAGRPKDVNRVTAMVAGLSTYWTPRLCPKGHNVDGLCERRTWKDGVCVQCSRTKTAKWKRNNPSRTNASTARYRAKAQAPVWADKNHIDFIYANCPAGYEVDHIIPLNGKGFGGLHVPRNLQYLPATINLAKGNRCVDVSTHAIVPPPFHVD